MAATESYPPNVLTIAGSDPSGGAGIQADLKAFSALGAYGMTAMTALTAQNTHGVSGVFPVDVGFLREQIDQIFADIQVDAVKIGMVGSAESVACVADRLAYYRPPCIVVDPVMVAKSGDRLIDAEATVALRDQLIPLATLITPNLPEAAVLLDETEPADGAGMEAMVERLLGLGPAAVLLKGGHLGGSRSDDLFAGGSAPPVWLRAARVQTRNTHGTGCTLSSAIAALVPQCETLAEAVGEAKQYLHGALEAADTLRVGGGQGPVHHFHALWRRARSGMPKTGSTK